MAIFPLTSWIYAALALPSWSALESKLSLAPPPVYKDSLPDDTNIPTDKKPVLYRDEDAICPYSQQVWLALEAKNVDYVTVLVPSSDTSPLKVTWPDGSQQTNSLEILERIQQEYPDQEPNLYPKGISECVDSVRCNIVRFKGVFPRRTSNNIYAPYLFLEQGRGLVSTSNHMVTLEETDEVLEEYYQGPFLCGKDFTAADIVWAPFLERYAVQLPCLLPGKPELDPRGGGEYPALREWYEAMESMVPCYSCRVQGDTSQWKRALELGIQQYNNQENNDDKVKLSNVTPVFPPHEIDGQALWNQYTINRPWLANTPEEECVAYIVRNRADIIDQASKKLAMSAHDADTALRQVIAVLLDKSETADKLSGNARDVASFVRDGIAVPRDLGMIPVMTLERIVKAAPAPRIA